VRLDVDAVSESTERLDELDSELSAVIQSIEDELVDHIRTRIVLVVSDFPSLHGDKLETHSIGVAKISDRWRLSWDGNPLTSAPRGIRSRVLALGVIDRLIEAAPALVAAQIDDRREALDKARELLKALRGV
jgi:hypothetical protein